MPSLHALRLSVLFQASHTHPSRQASLILAGGILSAWFIPFVNIPLFPWRPRTSFPLATATLRDALDMV
jgi:hypothetical protein